MLPVLMGTPVYMSPEQISPGRADFRSDVFAVGLVLYELLGRAGQPRSSLRIESQGSTEQRYQSLLAGRCAATLLRTPYELLAAQQGCRVLARSADVLAHYQGTVGATRQVVSSTMSTWAPNARMQSRVRST